MSLTTFNTNYLKGSYSDDVTFLLKIAENAPLAMGTNTSGLHPHIDGKQNLAIGYGYDFAANGTKQSIDDLKAAGATIMDEAKNIGFRPHFSYLGEINMFQAKHRNALTNSFCLVVVSFFMFTSNSNANQQSQICSEIHRLLILRQQGRAPDDFFVESLEHGGGGDIYPKLDIDGDGIDDSIVRSCGAGIDGLCFLFVKLSSGKEFELEEEKFFLARVKSNIYVVLGESLSQPEMAKLGKRRAYQITNQTIKLICPHF